MYRSSLGSSQSSVCLSICRNCLIDHVPGSGRGFSRALIKVCYAWWWKVIEACWVPYAILNKVCDKCNEQFGRKCKRTSKLRCMVGTTNIWTNGETTPFLCPPTLWARDNKLISLSVLQVCGSNSEMRMIHKISSRQQELCIALVQEPSKSIYS